MTEPTGQQLLDRYRRVLGCNLAWVALAIAILAAVMAVAAGLGSRFGLWHFRSGFSILRWAGILAVVSIPASLASLVISVQKRVWRCTGMSAAALAFGLVVFVVPLRWKLNAAKVPVIHDITTDVQRPPQFLAVLPLRKNAPNSAEYGGPAVAAQQQAAYPDITTKLVDLAPDEAFRRAVDTARRLGWKIVDEVPIEGRIEATDTTFWFGFTDDIVIRITPAGYRSLVDIRSVSRVGKSDAGTNAARIRKFFGALK